MGQRELEVTIVSAKDLNKVNLITKMDVYIIISISGTNLKQTVKTPVDKYSGNNPYWNFRTKFIIDESAAHQNLVFKLKCECLLDDKDIGEVNIPINELRSPEAIHGKKQFVNYQVRKLDGKPKGFIKFAYQFLNKVEKVAEQPNMVYPQPRGVASSSANPPPAPSSYANPPPAPSSSANLPSAPEYPLPKGKYPPPLHAEGGYPPPPKYSEGGYSYYSPPGRSRYSEGGYPPTPKHLEGGYYVYYPPLPHSEGGSHSSPKHSEGGYYLPTPLTEGGYPPPPPLFHYGAPPRSHYHGAPSPPQVGYPHPPPQYAGYEYPHPPPSEGYPTPPPPQPGYGYTTNAKNT